MKSGRRRGFTALAEHLPAEEVVAILNDHFDLLVDLISQHRGFVVIGDSTRQVPGHQLVVDGPMEAEGKGLDAVIRIWEVLALRGEKTLVLPSPVRDLAELPAPLDASVRVFHGKQLDHQSHPARLYRLGAGGVELESVAPLSVFGSLQMLLPLGAHGEPEALDGKVIALSERDGAPTALVCFTGIDWDMHERLEALARGERGRPAENRGSACSG